MFRALELAGLGFGVIFRVWNMGVLAFRTFGVQSVAPRV